MDQDFQILLTNTDYQRLQIHENENKNLTEENKKLRKQLEQQNQKIKDLQKAIYIRDSFIDYVASQSDYAFGEILGLDIIPADISQSMYQDVVTFEQNGISAIQMRQAMELYMQKNKRLFQRFNAVQDRFAQLKSKISLLEQKKPSRASIKSQQSLQLNISDLSLRARQLSSLTSDLNELRNQVQKMQQNRQKLQKQSQLLRVRNAKLLKQGEQLCKKLESQGQKSYIIKLMIDEYYGELQKNLVKIGGLNPVQIGVVIGNEMKGIKLYIDNLIKKATKEK